MFPRIKCHLQRVVEVPVDGLLTHRAATTRGSSTVKISRRYCRYCVDIYRVDIVDTCQWPRSRARINDSSAAAWRPPTAATAGSASSRSRNQFCQTCAQSVQRC